MLGERKDHLLCEMDFEYIEQDRAEERISAIGTAWVRS